MKYKKDIYSLIIRKYLSGNIYIILHKCGLSSPLDTVWFSTLKDNVDPELIFSFAIVRNLLNKWLPDNSNRGEYVVSCKFDRSEKTSIVTLSIGSYSKELVKVEGKYDLHESIVDYIKMHI
jgi:hypothetical protein